MSTNTHQLVDDFDREVEKHAKSRGMDYAYMYGHMKATLRAVADSHPKARKALEAELDMIKRANR